MGDAGPPAARAADAAASRRLASDRAVVGALAGLAALSVLLRLALVTRAHAPIVFRDELGYTKLAQSIGLDGRLALFDREGLTYSPLYPLVLSPIYALGASAPAAYAAIKVVNAFLISLAVFPLYKVARFVLPRRDSLAVAGVSVLAPLMSFPAFTMSENLAYPLCLVALWALLAAVERPGRRRDALLLAAILLATAARAQLIVLLPAALTAALLAGAASERGRLLHRLRNAVGSHALLFGFTAAGLVAAGIRALAGGDVYSVFGRYANVGRAGLPDPLRVLELGLHHLAGLDLAVGVVPFVATLVAALAFARARFPRRYVPFAAVAASFTVWLLLEVAVDAALFDSPGGDDPRIHERFLIYAIPLFLVGLAASVRMPRAPRRLYVAAGLAAAALPAAIPFGEYVNATNVVDTFALLPFGRSDGAQITAARFSVLGAVWAAAILALVYVRFVRQSLGRAVVVVALVFAYGSLFVWARIDEASAGRRSVLPAHTNWVDRAHPAGEVVLVTGTEDDLVPALETAYHNLGITRVYTLCRGIFSAEFGERRLHVGASGRLLDEGRPVAAPYAIVPERLRLQGRVLARNGPGGQVLVAPSGRNLVLTRGSPATGCG